MDSLPVCSENCAAIGQLKRKLRQQLLRDLFHGAPPAGSSLEEINEYYGFRFVPGNFNVTVIRLTPRVANSKGSLTDALKYADEDIRRILSSENLPEMESLIEDDSVNFLINFTAAYDTPKAFDLHDAIARFYDYINSSERYSKFIFTLGDGMPVGNIFDVGSCLESARSAVEDYGVGLRKNRHNDSVDQMRALTQIMNVLTPARRARFGNYLRSREMDKLAILVREIFDDCRPYLEDFPTIRFQLPYRLLDLCLDSCGDSVSNNAELLQILIDCRSEVDNNLSYSKLPEIVISGLERFCRQYFSYMNSDGNSAVYFARNYMWSNYSKKISLDEIANHVHLNPRYFSTLFKREMGESVFSYLTSLRLEQAMLMLKNTLLPIIEIAHQVGYDDPEYFSRLFRKKLGVTPRQYRSSAAGPNGKEPEK